MTTEIKGEAAEKWADWLENEAPKVFAQDISVSDLLSVSDNLIDKATLAERERSDMKIAGVMKDATLAERERILNKVKHMKHTIHTPVGGISTVKWLQRDSVISAINPR